MAAYTGAELARGALREIGVLTPTEAGDAELLNDALALGTDVLDSWRNDGLTIDGVTRSVYSLSANTQSYTIGSGGTFSQDYPNSIHLWSVIPNDAASNPLEIPMGRPLNEAEWQRIRIKSQTGSYPRRMWFNRAWAAGLGNCLFHPIPTGSAVDVVLYQSIPQITALVSGTTYNLRPGFPLAIKLNLAVYLLSGRFKREGDWSQLYAHADKALASVKRKAINPKESPMRAEYSIGSGRNRRTFNIRTGGS